jgi:hypothetical protein
VSHVFHLVAFKSAYHGVTADAAKLRGRYYTPSSIASLLARWAVRHSHVQVLELSCGDGGIVTAVPSRLNGEGHVFPPSYSNTFCRRVVRREGFHRRPSCVANADLTLQIMAATTSANDRAIVGAACGIA